MAGTVGGREHLRLFCGLPLPPETAARLAEWQGAELTEGRIVVPGNLHVTLAFLGTRPADDAAAVAGALREAAARLEPPVLTVGSYRETRSVGMLVLEEAEGRAAALAEGLHTRLERLGLYERERRPWLPHVTVLRFRHAPHLAPPVPALGEIRPVRAALYHSVLRPQGAQYEILETAVLGG